MAAVAAAAAEARASCLAQAAEQEKDDWHAERDVLRRRLEESDLARAHAESRAAAAAAEIEDCWVFLSIFFLFLFSKLLVLLGVEKFGCGEEFIPGLGDLKLDDPLKLDCVVDELFC